MAHYKLERTGDRPIEFDGTITRIVSSATAGAEYWHVLEHYITTDSRKIILSITECHKGRAGLGKRTVYLCDSMDDVVEILKGYNAITLTFPSVKDRYQKAVSEFLDDYPEILEPKETAPEEPVKKFVFPSCAAMNFFEMCIRKFSLDDLSRRHRPMDANSVVLNAWKMTPLEWSLAQQAAMFQLRDGRPGKTLMFEWGGLMAHISEEKLVDLANKGLILGIR